MVGSLGVTAPWRFCYSNLPRGKALFFRQVAHSVSDQHRNQQFINECFQFGLDRWLRLSKVWKALATHPVDLLLSLVGDSPPRGIAPSFRPARTAYLKIMCSWNASTRPSPLPRFQRIAEVRPEGFWNALLSKLVRCLKRIQPRGSRAVLLTYCFQEYAKEPTELHLRIAGSDTLPHEVAPNRPKVVNKVRGHGNSFRVALSHDCNHQVDDSSETF